MQVPGLAGESLADAVDEAAAQDIDTFLAEVVSAVAASVSSH